MGQSPFAKRPDKDLNLGRRRSTRVELATPVIVSGRDASGQPFREATQTLMVNLHGAKVLTRHSVLVGMQVSIECTSTGLAGKAVCVHIEPSNADTTKFEMALQLIVPANIWGVENPPEDWYLGEPSGAARREAPGRSSGVFFAGVRTAGSHEDSPHAAEAPSKAPSAPSLTEFEKRVADILERALAAFEARLRKLEAESQARMESQSAQALEQLETLTRHSEKRLNMDIEESREELAAVIEEIVRAKVNQMFAALLQPAGSPPPVGPPPAAEKEPEKD